MKYRIEGWVYRWGASDIKRTRTIEAETETEARNKYSRDITIELGKAPMIERVYPVREKDTTKTSEKLAALPPEIALKVKGLLKAHRINKFSFSHTKSVYLEEDADFYAWTPESGWNVTRMGGEWGGFKSGVAGAVGKNIFLPAGAFVIECQIFLGKYLVSVYHNNGINSLEA